MLTLLLALGLASAACPSSVGVSEVVSSIGGAEASFAAMDLESFQVAAAQARDRLPCLREQLTTIDAAAFHRIMGFEAWTQRALDVAAESFQSALIIQPAYTLPSSIAPPGNPLYALYDGARDRPPGEVIELEVPAGAVALVDGSRSTSLPRARPAIVQLLSETGRVLQTDLVEVGDPAPQWAALGLPPPTPPTRVSANIEVPAPDSTPRARPSTGLLLAGGGAVLASAGVYGVALASRARYDADDTPLEDLGGIRALTNGLVLTSGGLGVVGVGLGVSAFVFTAHGTW